MADALKGVFFSFKIKTKKETTVWIYTNRCPKTFSISHECQTNR